MRLQSQKEHKMSDVYPQLLTESNQATHMTPKEKESDLFTTLSFNPEKKRTSTYKKLLFRNQNGQIDPHGDARISEDYNSTTYQFQPHHRHLTPNDRGSMPTSIKTPKTNSLMPATSKFVPKNGISEFSFQQHQRHNTFMD